MKKVLLILFVIALAIPVFAEGQKETNDGSYTIAYIQPGPNAYYDNSSAGAKMAGDVTGHDVIIYNSDFKPEKEVANVEDAIVLGADGIILFSMSTDAATQAIKRANDAGVPIHMIYGYSDEFASKVDGFIQANGLRSGGLIGEWTAENVDSGEVAIITGALGRGDAEAYSQGFEDALAENPALEIVAQEPADWDPGLAFTVMENLITSYPDLQAVFVQNEPMAIAAHKALKAQSKDGQVVLVSQNGSPEGLDAIESGILSATAGWSPASEAQIAFSRLIGAIEGTAPDPQLMDTPITVLSPENLGDADPWVPTMESTKKSLGL